MYELKTKENENNVMQFINRLQSSKRKEDALKLLNLFTNITGIKARMWGDSMIGFGSYHYEYISRHSGDAMIVGFSPRNAKISLYLTTSNFQREKILDKLGKYTLGKGCIYINSLSDIDENILKELIIQGIMFICETYPQNSIADIQNSPYMLLKIRKITEVDNFIRELPEDIKNIVSILREIILSASDELIEDFKWSMPNYYYNGMVCYIQAFKNHVNLGFAQGDKLLPSDLNVILQGTGKSMRHIKIESMDEVSADTFSEIIKLAVAQNKNNL